MHSPQVAVARRGVVKGHPAQVAQVLPACPAHQVVAVSVPLVEGSSAVATGLGVLRNPSLAPVVGADHLLVPAAVKASMLHVFLLALTKICLNGYSAQRSS